jgi:hypothetical protein
MPEPKESKRKFDSQVNSALGGVRIVSQADAGQPANAENSPASIQPPEPALVTRLIDFIKSI